MNVPVDPEGLTTASVALLTTSNSKTIGHHVRGKNLLCVNRPHNGLKHAFIALNVYGGTLGGIPGNLLVVKVL